MDDDNYEFDETSKKSSYTVFKVFIALYTIFKLFSMILAGYLSWNCGLENLNPVRVFKTSFCVIFSEFYLVYFFVNSVVLGYKC